MAEPVPAVLRAVERVVDGLAVTLFLMMFALVLASVVTRAFGEPLVWGDELTRYLFVWIALLGWAVAMRRGSHIAIGNIVALLPAPVRLGFELAAGAGVLVLAAVLARNGLTLVERNLDIETVTLFFPFAVVYAAVPVAALLLALETLRRMAASVLAFRAGSLRP
ncbi:TRAP transporter small permease subunit [Azospirillum sp. RWY-5-1]|uniref:TRAP transporter small permease protein n=1 Tax=Azospirillum oleiclasticum TaxID=2735135 RepID=A0ABX2TGM3_9PROT|nr:TRAP transporter small permease subunit [Azospirillum oleiclasticum]NYZ17230.1 TRAP transporter small permease subunit [Azospirillum oleiclasticum]NYZ23486.1 TRAP transporter small permease subunit [Azospirillum oleiclasticum]